MRVAFVELLHLAEGAPAVVAVSRAAEIGVADCFEAARQVVSRRQLMGQALVLHEAVLTRQVDSLLVQTHGVGVSLFKAGDLGRYQRVLIGESRWIVFGPLAQLFPMRHQEFAPPLLLVARRGRQSTPPPSARNNKSSRAAGSGRLQPKGAASACRLPREPRRSRLTGTAPSV